MHFAEYIKTLQVIRTSLIKERASSPRLVLFNLAVVIRSSCWKRQEMKEINQVVYICLIKDLPRLTTKNEEMI